MLRELQEVAQLGAKAKVHRLCVQLARNGRGVKGRRYTHDSGCIAVHGRVNKSGWSLRPSAPADLNRETAARNDLRDTLRLLKRGPKSKSCPEWSAPAGTFDHGAGPTVLCCA